jgi:hypothetical protein
VRKDRKSFQKRYNNQVKHSAAVVYFEIVPAPDAQRKFHFYVDPHVWGFCPVNSEPGTANGELLASEAAPQTGEM